LYSKKLRHARESFQLSIQSNNVSSMKKQTLMLGLLMGSYQLMYAQSATVLPQTADFINNSSADDAYAVKGTTGNGTGGANSKGVWGHSLSFGADGSGVYGSHAGSGVGVQGTSVYGIGVYGVTTSGTAMSANAINGPGFICVSGGNNAARFQITNPANGYGAVEISTQGDGTGLETTTYGTGSAGHFRNVNPNGSGAGLVVEKHFPYIFGYTSAAKADLEVRHAVSLSGIAGIRIFNTGGNSNSWTLYTDNVDGGLFLFAKGDKKGTFNASTGAYTTTSDVRLKKNISNYTSTLKNLMKIDVKAYQLLNSDKTEIGLMAQQTLKYFPEIVYNNTNEKGEQYYSMDYSRIGVLAIKAIQEQQTIIQKQQKEINTLKEQVKALDTLKSEVEELKKLMKSNRR
jgi:hypothetical protein